jgi:putative endonuclease
MASVYILYSSQLNKYYTGSCKTLQERLELHNSKTYYNSYTSNAEDWKMFYSVDDLEYSQARQIEAHIKKMKSRQYIENLVKYPEIMEKLKVKYI